MKPTSSINRDERRLPSPPLGGEREGPAPQAWEGGVGPCTASGIPHLTSILSAPGGGEEAPLR